MKYMYAPWRALYAQKIDVNKQANTPQSHCDFCIQPAAQQDEKHFIVRRFKNTFVCLNLYPYNAGHLLVIPLSHKAHLYDLSAEVRAEIMEISSASVSILQEVLKADGVNIGINLGKAAGAGMPSHLHMHVLPRWNGDTNFMPALTDTKVISIDLKDIFQKLKPAFEKLVI